MTEIVLGPPGTGKTTRLIGLVEEELARGVAPDRIGYVSFTRRAADEARDRATKKFNLGARDLPWFRTLHSLCFEALGLSSAEVLEGGKLREFGDWVGVSVSGKVSVDEGTTFGFDTGDRCLFMDNLARVRKIPLRQKYEEDTDGLPWQTVDHVSRGLVEFKRARGLRDFTDMLAMFVETEWSARLEVLFVDEAQDLSALQWDVVGKLAQGARRVVVAGDDDQSIYRWAGADTDHFVSLPGDEQVLTQSWRVPEAVSHIATSLLSRIARRRPKQWLPRSGAPGEVARVGSLDDVDFGRDGTTLILARNTCFLKDDAMPLLDSEGILYNFRGGQSVRRSLVGAILDWERLRRGEAVPVADVLKIYEQMEAGIGYQRGSKKLPHWKEKDSAVTLADLREHGGLLTDEVWYESMTRVTAADRQSMQRALRHGEKLTREPRVTVSTIHGSKGGEADHVILLRDVAWRTYQESLNWPEDEARCWYVAATRAREKLTIVAPQKNQDRAYDV